MIRRRPLPSWLVVLCTIGFSHAAFAQTSASGGPAWTVTGSIADLVPVTVITRRMIDDAGARTLKDALVAFVPGMTFSQDQNEVNVAMRGVYSSSQAKFLILINGHDLNFRSYQTADPDFSVALDSIDRIEVARGPLSAVYGDGALTAVVNVITTTGAALDRTTASVTAGSFNQVRLEGVFGSGTTNGADVLAWGSLYRSEGQTVDVPAADNLSRTPGDGQAYLDRFMGPPSHDVGLNLTRGRFALFAAHRYGKYVEPFSDGGATGETYVYDDYLAPVGGGPGLGIGATNLQMSVVEPLAGRTKVEAVAYVDRRDLSAHLVSDPTTEAHQLVYWSEWGSGAIVRLSGHHGRGDRAGRWLAGAQFDRMRVDDSALFAGTGSQWTTVGPKGGLLELGSEEVYSGFVQASEPLGRRWQANAALRVDRKARHDGTDIDEVSPAVRLTYTASPAWNVSASYSKGYVDAPYWYRYNTLASYRGGRSLQPERLQSFQVTPERRVSANARARLNVFVNRLENGIWRNNAAGPSEPIYLNGGELSTWGLEPEVSRTAAGLRVSAALTYQRVIHSENEDVVGTRIANVPSLAASATVAVNPWAGTGRDVWFDVTGRYIGSQASPITVTLGGIAISEPANTVDAAFVVDAGARIGWAGRYRLEGRVLNAFDAAYDQGGSVVHPYPQPGRSATVTLGGSF